MDPHDHPAGPEISRPRATSPHEAVFPTIRVPSVHLPVERLPADPVDVEIYLRARVSADGYVEIKSASVTGGAMTGAPHDPGIEVRQ